MDTLLWVILLIDGVLLEGTTDVSFVAGKQTQWLDYLPSPALAVKATSGFCAVAMQDGCVNVYSPTGRRCVFLNPCAANYFSIFFYP